MNLKMKAFKLTTSPPTSFLNMPVHGTTKFVNPCPRRLDHLDTGSGEHKADRRSDSGTRAGAIRRREMGYELDFALWSFVNVGGGGGPLPSGPLPLPLLSLPLVSPLGSSEGEATQNGWSVVV
jgi:hypothetical protein